MARTIATFAGGPSRGAIIGEQAGGAFQQAFTDSFGEERKRRELAGLGGSPAEALRGSSNPFFAALADSPEVVGKLMQDPRGAQMLGSAMQPKEPEGRTTTRLVTHDSPLNERYNLDIQPGQSARVEFEYTGDGVLKSTHVKAVNTLPGAERENTLKDYMETFNVPRGEAIKLADSGMLQLTTDELGNRVLTDKLTGKSMVTRLVGVNEQPRAPVAEGVKPEDLAFDPAVGTGFWASAQGAWNKGPGQIPLLPVFQEPERVARELINLERNTQMALRTSSRPLVFEAERVAALVPDAMMWTQNPRVARNNVARLMDDLGRQFADDLRVARSSQGRVSAEAMERAESLERVIRGTLSPDASNRLIQFYRNSVEAPTAPDLDDGLQDLLDKWDPR
jgi:hypothetical protein